MGIEDLVGKTLGTCELRQFLGVGGMGAVYLGFQTSLDRDVAVKVLPGSLATQPGSVESFRREARIVAALEHAHIVPIYDFGTQDGISYIVMRLLTGGSLGAHLNQHLLTLDETRRLLRELADALDYAHSRRIIHLDIKPSNVMFDHRSTSYLVDFGIAKLMTTGDLTRTNDLKGTPSYMAPEQWRSEAVSPATDVYSLGILTYHVLTSRLPYEAPTPYALMLKHLYEKPTPVYTLNPALPPQIDAVLAAALSKDSRLRYRTAGDFVEAFERAVQTMPPHASGWDVSLPASDPVIDYDTSPSIGDSETSPDLTQDEAKNGRQRTGRLGIGVTLLLVVVALTFVVGRAVLSATATPTVTSPAAEVSDAAQTQPIIPPPATSPTATASLAPSASPTALPSATTAPSENIVPVVPPASNTPTDTRTLSPTNTLTATPSATSTVTHTDTPMPTQTFSPTQTVTPTNTFTAVIAAPATPVIQQFYGRLTSAMTTAQTQFDWQAGEAVSICLKSTEFDTYLRLLAPDGNEAAHADDTIGTDACIADFVLPASGTYTAAITSFDGRATGSYTLEVTMFRGCGQLPIALVIYEPGINLRSLPSSVRGSVVRTAQMNECFPVAARTVNGMWWQVEDVRGLAWVSAGGVRTIGSTTALPILSP